jgi:hypothetical protein
MDEKKLAELLKEVVAETPPPTFTHADVTKESARQQQRRRNGLLAGSAFGVAVLAGATALGVALWTGGPTPSAVTSPEVGAYDSNESAAPYELPDEGGTDSAQAERGEEQGFPPEGSKQGDSSAGNGGPAGPASTPRGCEQVDRELAAALAGELPAAAKVKVDDAIPVSLSCPEGATGAAYDLPGGRISVILMPDDAALATASTRGTQADAPTTDGRQVFLVSEPVSASGTAPFGSDIERIATELGQLY